MNQIQTESRITVGPQMDLVAEAWTDEAQRVLTPEACAFLAQLVQRFEGPRQELLAARSARQQTYDDGLVPTYLNPHSAAVTSRWTVGPIPNDLWSRRVEITGPINNAKMVIQMLSRNDQGARADCAMLDFEDSMMPSWKNVISGHLNLMGAVTGDLTYQEHEGSKRYALDPEDMAVIMVRARGLHLNESNLHFQGDSISASLLDLGLAAFHTARLLVDQNKTPKFYIPKVEHYLEARWWNRVLNTIEEELGLPEGTLRVTLLIETLPAAFQMEEILYEMRTHAVGLNVGRWDKIFSDIKTLKQHADRIMPDRASIDMSRPWMRHYAERLVHICHRRGAFALGGMAAFTPGRTQSMREEQLRKVIADKQLESKLGHDGCWVSHPFFIGPAQSQFPEPNQLHVHADSGDRYPDLLPHGGGPRTMAGLRTNIRVGIAYIHGWDREIGCIAWDNLMEDLATLEISRAQVWQWLHHHVTLDDGVRVTTELIASVFDEERNRIIGELALEGDDLEAWARAATRAKDLFCAETFQSFLALESPQVEG
ncbi:MAG: malate synthase A [Acidobacteria bacterium]|nr:malate synthase A [Acidobacteriota bacterium]